MVFLLILNLFFFSLSKAGELESLIDYALKNSPRLKVYQSMIESTKHRETYSKSLPNPSLSVGLNNLPLNRPYPNKYEPMSNLSIGISQMYMLPIKREREALMALKERLALLEEEELLKRELIKDIKLSYLEWLYTFKREDVLNRIKREIDTLYKLAEENYKYGKTNLSDLLFLKGEQIKVESELEKVKLERESKKEELDYLVGKRFELKLAEELKREDLRKAALQKLSYLKAGDVISSPYSGVIVERKVYEGGFLKAGDVAYKIADISKVWVIAEVPQEYAGIIKKGTQVLVSPVGQEESYEGIVDYIFPEADKMARTIKVRINLPNKNAKLKINQMVDVYFERPLGNVLAVPEDAVVDTGKRKVVFVEREPGVYEPRNVKLGRKAQGYYQVLEGLREGERVVVRGAFLLDSEAQLKGLYGEEVKGHEHHH